MECFHQASQSGDTMLCVQSGGARGREQEEAAADSFLNRLSFVAENEEDSGENQVTTVTH